MSGAPPPLGARCDVRPATRRPHAGSGSVDAAVSAPTLLPAMTLREALDTTRIHRVAGRTGARTALVTTRPCRAPHHTISDVGLIGGGQVPMPGEVSRAHHPMRWLDAQPACGRHILKGLCQPLEDGVTGIQSPVCR
jgi:magnesium chelatase family protein